MSVNASCRVFLSTPSARRATKLASVVHGNRLISIHALREEGDAGQRGRILQPCVISIHALREEGDRRPILCPAASPRFLSTPSARRATWPTLDMEQSTGLISIHALREEGDLGIGSSKSPVLVFLSTPSARRATCFKSCFSNALSYFYPRPPRGGRRCTKGTEDRKPKFLSTPSARRATAAGFPNPKASRISIHALREEGDFFVPNRLLWEH